MTFALWPLKFVDICYRAVSGANGIVLFVEALNDSSTLCVNLVDQHRFFGVECLLNLI